MSLITHDVNSVQTPVGGYLCQRLLEGQPTAFVSMTSFEVRIFPPRLGQWVASNF